MVSSDFEVKPRDFCWVRPPGGPSKFIAVSEEYHVEHLQGHLGAFWSNTLVTVLGINLRILT